MSTERDFNVKAETPPIREDADGALRVGESRVLLELVIRSFQDGATPEVIVQRYSTLELSDVYAVVAYYLRHRSEIDDYLDRRENIAQDMEEKIAANQGDLRDIRARLQSRRRA